ncbi:MAG: acyl carrier protein [Actinomycetota bacterium]|nr:acyl carrier protein [Actinomycetota bacterium]
MHGTSAHGLAAHRPTAHASSARRTALEGTVRSVLCRQLRIEPDSLTHDVDLREIGVDDDEALRVIVEVEQELDVRFPDDFLDGIHTYGDLTSAVMIAVGE